MKREWIFLALAWGLFCPAIAFSQDAKVRTSLATKEDVWVGQRVALVVELMASGVFSGAPVFDVPSVPGLLLLPPSGSPVLSAEDEGGVSYTMQRHELSVFARRTGEIEIPPFTVRLAFKLNPLDAQPVSQTVKTDVLHFRAKSPPGAEHLGAILSARDLTGNEDWRPLPEKAKTGDAFTRTITFSASDIPAMAFPPFPAAPIDGLGIYPKAPEVLDRNDRGEMRGERRDTIVYVCERAGQFVIPAARLTWWDLDTQELRIVDFPARTVVVAADPSLAPQDSRLTPERSRSMSSLAIGAVCVVVAVFAMLAGRIIGKKSWAALLRMLACFRAVPLQPLNPPIDDEETTPFQSILH